MATKQIAFMFLLAAANLQRSQTAKLSANDNAPYFNALCDMIKLATAKLPDLEHRPELSEFAAAAELVKLSYTDPDALKQIADTKTAVNNIDTAGTAANTYCKEGKTATCRTLAELLGESRKNTHAKTIFRALSSQRRKRQVEEAATAMRRLLGGIKRSDAAEQLKSAKADINEALEGKPNGTADDTDLVGDRDRATTCGRPASPGTRGTKAGASLALDTICVCGKDNTQTETNACGFEITASGTGDITWASGANAAAQWANARRYCKDEEGEARLSGDALRHSIRTFQTALSLARLASSSFAGCVGTIGAGPTSGCTGEKGTNDGCCVFYGRARRGGRGEDIRWERKLLSASSKIDAAQRAMQGDLHILSQIQALNVTLTALIIAPEGGRDAEPAEDGVSTESRKEKTMEEKKKECEQHKNNKTYCENAGKCKWEGKADADGSCVVDESKVKEQTNAATGTGDGAAATTTEKCKGKPEKDCKSPDCKWEGETCKDSSFLANKQFALSVLSAAFVALLF